MIANFLICFGILGAVTIGAIVRDKLDINEPFNTLFGAVIESVAFWVIVLMIGNVLKLTMR